MIDFKQLCCNRRCWIVTVAALVYFVMFPDDGEALLAPLRSVLTLSSDLSLGLYILAAVALVCWTARSIWSGREQVRSSSNSE